MELTEDSYPARIVKRGYQHGISLAAGKSLKIETSPNGAEILDEEVPAGKAWTVSVNVTIREVSA